MKPNEIKELRERLRLTQEEFGKLVGASSRTVSNWENGSNIPESKLSRIAAIAEAPESSGNNFAAGRDIHHINTSVEKVLECLNAQQAMTAEALAQNSKLIQIIDRLTNN